ncbi:MAG: hypothetical protein PHU21_06220 [Elusimicrobia bacterium]|jgi:hypothetical protein|nr:hypothetical protein [Elusimicrobiota bacterium]
MSSIPRLRTAQHGWQDRVHLLTTADSHAGRFTLSGGRAYVHQGEDVGTVLVDCTHNDP